MEYLSNSAPKDKLKKQSNELARKFKYITTFIEQFGITEGKFIKMSDIKYKVDIGNTHQLFYKGNKISMDSGNSVYPYRPDIYQLVDEMYEITENASDMFGF